MKIGIVGYSGSGKTTLFNALTGLNAEVGGFSSKGGQNIGQINVPDERLDFLARQHQPKKTTYATITFVDYAGSKMGESRTGLDAQAVGDMRTADALALVVRGFESVMTTDAPAPADELENLAGEIVLNDLVLVERRLERLAKEGNKARDEVALFERLKETLEEERPLRSLELRKDELDKLSGFQFLTLKPFIAVLNIGEENVGADFSDVASVAERLGMKLIVLPAKIEMELNELPVDERREFLDDLGIEEPALDTFIRAAFEAVDLIVFFTTGKDECRAWPIRRGSTAVEAAGKIHSDIARGFIRAEVIHWADVEALGSEQECKKQGKMRLEGKEYVVLDGDIVHFRFNV